MSSPPLGLKGTTFSARPWEADCPGRRVPIQDRNWSTRLEEWTVRVRGDCPRVPGAAAAGRARQRIASSAIRAVRRRTTMSRDIEIPPIEGARRPLWPPAPAVIQNFAFQVLDVEGNTSRIVRRHPYSPSAANGQKGATGSQEVFGSGLKIWLQAHKRGCRVAGRGEIELLREISAEEAATANRRARGNRCGASAVSAPGSSPGSAARPASGRRRPGTGRRGRSRRSAARRALC